MISNPGGEALCHAYLASRTPEPEHDEDLCACNLLGSKAYTLTIEFNSVASLTCQTCGKPVEQEWIADALKTAAPLPVTVAWTTIVGDGYVVEHDFYGEITPRQDGGAP